MSTTNSRKSRLEAFKIKSEQIKAAIEDLAESKNISISYGIDDALSLLQKIGGSIKSFKEFMNDSISTFSESDFLGLTSIPKYCFSGKSNITSIELPATITNIGINAFENCSGLENIYIKGSSSTTKITSFENAWCYGCSSTLVIHLSSNFASLSDAYLAFGNYFDNYSENGKLIVAFDQ